MEHEKMFKRIEISLSCFFCFMSAVTGMTGLPVACVCFAVIAVVLAIVYAIGEEDQSGP